MRRRGDGRQVRTGFALPLEIHETCQMGPAAAARKSPRAGPPGGIRGVRSGGGGMAYSIGGGRPPTLSMRRPGRSAVRPEREVLP